MACNYSNISVSDYLMKTGRIKTDTKESHKDFFKTVEPYVPSTDTNKETIKHFDLLEKYTRKNNIMKIWMDKRPELKNIIDNKFSTVDFPFEGGWKSPECYCIYVIDTFYICDHCKQQELIDRMRYINSLSSMVWVT